MKTILFASQDGSKTVQAKCDIFAKNTELLTPGFDTRFTHMEIVETEGAVVDGVALAEIENSWQSVITFAISKGYSLKVSDINEGVTSDVVNIGAALTGTVAGTKGASALTGTGTNFDPQLAVGDKVLVDGFVYTIATRAGAADTAATIEETFLTTFTGESIYLVEKQ